MALSETIPTVDIDSKGRFKYVLLKLFKNNSSEFKYLIRGGVSFSYHADILEAEEAKFSDTDYKLECLGGGRILHQPEENSISVYGYSIAFGKADHSVTVDLLKRHFPSYTSIVVTNDGS